MQEYVKWHRHETGATTVTTNLAGAAMRPLEARAYETDIAATGGATGDV